MPVRAAGLEREWDIKNASCKEIAAHKKAWHKSRARILRNLKNAMSMDSQKTKKGTILLDFLKWAWYT